MSLSYRETLALLNQATYYKTHPADGLRTVQQVTDSLRNLIATECRNPDLADLYRETMTAMDKAATAFAHADDEDSPAAVRAEQQDLATLTTSQAWEDLDNGYRLIRWN